MRTRRRESRESWSYRHSSTALRACALRIDPHDTFDPATSTFSVDELPETEGQYVEVLLELNVNTVAEQAEVNLDDLEFVLLCSNFESRRVMPLWRSSAVGHPRRWSGHVPCRVLSPRRYELVLQMMLARECRRQPSRPWRQGSIIAERSWKITSPTASSLFAVDWTSFSEREGWDSNAMWRVEFISSDGFDSTLPEEAVRLHVNKDLEALRVLFTRTAKRSPRLGPVTNVLVPMVLSGVTAEILGRVLRWAHHVESRGELDYSDIQSDSLAGRTFEAADKLGLNAVDATRIAVEQPGEMAMLIQGHFKLGQSLGAAALERMRRE